MTSRSNVRPPGSARLFADSVASAPPAGVHTANIDGASRGNPGPASYAVVVRDPSGKVIFEHAKNIGRETNNVAEYYALLAALDYATAHAIKALRIRSDSELLVRQMQGRYKVKSPELRPLHERAAKLARQLAYFQIEHVRRELNRDADALANVALDRAGESKSGIRGSNVQLPVASNAETAYANSNRHSARVQPASLTVNARFERGVFVPTESLDLPEGSHVQIVVHIPQKA